MSDLKPMSARKGAKSRGREIITPTRDHPVQRAHQQDKRHADRHLKHGQAQQASQRQLRRRHISERKEAGAKPHPCVHEFQADAIHDVSQSFLGHMDQGETARPLILFVGVQPWPHARPALTAVCLKGPESQDPGPLFRKRSRDRYLMVVTSFIARAAGAVVWVSIATFFWPP